ncbi:enoyl-CoA hydratase/isomerase family protein [Pilimelia columellifera subsp. columellifera]|uniref:Enoyl-CoA hydratase/isomerase family protein n=1 Tax=Pilimelia columellifera subsp. columellifera TaxID=706583 RepID=A0ABP6AIR4_9ACTN
MATVTLCRPVALNAQTPETWAALADIGRVLPGQIRLVIVRGEGTSFSAGLDRALLAGGVVEPGSEDTPQSLVAQLVAAGPDACAARIEQFQRGFAWLSRPDLISVAAVQGHAIGAGFQLALACDLRVLASDARLAMAEVTLGLVPDLGGTKRLSELVGYGRALELCVTGRQIDAVEAHAMGLATLVVAPADLAGATDDLAAAVLAADRDAVAEIKALLLSAGSRDQRAQSRAEREAQTRRLFRLAGLGD